MRAVRGALAGLSLAIFLASRGTSIANVALPTPARSFDASFQEAQWVVLAYLLSSTTVIVSVGRPGDLTGRRRLLIAGIALFTTVPPDSVATAMRITFLVAAALVLAALAIACRRLLRHAGRWARRCAPDPARVDSGWRTE